MGRSQRHMMIESNVDATCVVYTQGAISPGVMEQALAGAPAGVSRSVREVLSSRAVTIPMGPPGGPLQGSTLTGPIPESAIPEVPDPPTVSAISPNTAVVGDPDALATVTGTMFGADSVIVFDGVPLVTTWVSDTSLTATLPLSTTPEGDIPVTVTSSALTSGAITFTMTAAAGRSSGTFQKVSHKPKKGR
jgi:hypothetical protein